MTENSVEDRRQFGRRATNQVAAAVLPNQIVLPCVIENVSDGGALLRFTEGAAPIQSFRLTIEDTAFNIVCELRHAKGRIVGVRFARLADGAALSRFLIDAQSASVSASGRAADCIPARIHTARPAASVKALRELFMRSIPDAAEVVAVETVGARDDATAVPSMPLLTVAPTDAAPVGIAAPV